MTSKANILAQLRGQIASIEQDRGIEFDAPAAQGASVHRPSESEGRPLSSPSLASSATRNRGAQGHLASPVDEEAEDIPSAPDEARSAQDAYQKILRIIAVRERSTAYLRERLVTKEGFPPCAAEEALQKAQRLHLVDDRRYGDALIRMRLAAGKGLRTAEQEIQELGIDPTTLDAWQEHHERGRDAEVDRALQLLRRRPPRAKQAREAAFRKLVGQGYSTDVAATAARRWVEERDAPAF